MEDVNIFTNEIISVKAATEVVVVVLLEERVWIDTTLSSCVLYFIFSQSNDIHENN